MSEELYGPQPIRLSPIPQVNAPQATIVITARDPQSLKVAMLRMVDALRLSPLETWSIETRHSTTDVRLTPTSSCS